MIETTNIYLGTTRDGYKVYDRTDSHFHSETGLTTDILKKALSRMYANGSSFKKKEIHFRTPIGFNHCVKVSPQDEVVMVYRKGRYGKTPMVKQREPEPSNILNIILLKDKKYTDRYTLISCYIGENAPREPWDKGIQTSQEKEQCEKYWSTHALLYNPELVDWDRM